MIEENQEFSEFLARISPNSDLRAEAEKLLTYLRLTVSDYFKDFSESALISFQTKQIVGFDQQLIRRAAEVLDMLGVRFVINIADGVGHWIQELDYFARKLHVGVIDRNKHYILIRRPNSNRIVDGCLKIYSGLFSFSSCDLGLYLTLLPISAYCPQLVVDVGQSRMKWQIPDNPSLIGRGYAPGDPQAYIYQSTKDHCYRDFADYYRLRDLSRSYIPLRIDSRDFVSAIGLDPNRPIACIHIKTGMVVNATAAVVDPVTYIPAIEHLKSNNFQILFIGRERMPDIFAQLGVLNYAQSQFANFENDIRLINASSFCLIAGSGLFILPDCIDVPLLYVNFWHVNRLPFSRSTVFIPTRVIEKTTSRLITLREQAALYEFLPEDGGEYFPEHAYQAINASGDEILEGTKEALSPNRDLNPLQLKYQSCLVRSPKLRFDARCSSYFLEKYRSLLD